MISAICGVAVPDEPFFYLARQLIQKFIDRDLRGSQYELSCFALFRIPIQSGGISRCIRRLRWRQSAPDAWRMPARGDRHRRPTVALNRL